MPIRPRLRRGCRHAPWFALALGVACSSSPNDGRRGAGAGAGASGGTAARGASAGSGAGTMMTSGSTGGLGGANAPMPAIVVDAAVMPEECASASHAASQTPLDMYIVLDASGSMSAPYWTAATPMAGDCNVGDTLDSRWCFTINALATFFQEPSSAGMGTAIQFFNRQLVPLVHCATGGPVNTPAVPLGELPGNAAALIAALNAATTIDGTPTEPAIRGLINYTAASRKPDREMVGVLITDGAPSDCNTDAAFLGQLLADHLGATGIRTFVIGMTGANFDVLETIAVAGGADAHADHCATPMGGPPPASCHYYDVGNGDGTALTDALRAITLTAIGCELPLPEGDSPGHTIDPTKVNVEFTDGVGDVHEFVKVAGPNACEPWAWHYDDDANPSTLVLCDAPCDLISIDGKGRLDIVVGCETRTPD